MMSSHPRQSKTKAMIFTFTEGITIHKEAKKTLVYATRCRYGQDASYRVALTFVPRTVTRHLVSTVWGDGQEKLVKYSEKVDFPRREYSETVNQFGKEKKIVYKTTCTYNPNFLHYRYLSKLEIKPVLITPAEPATESVDSIANHNGDLQLCY